MNIAKRLLLVPCLFTLLWGSASLRAEESAAGNGSHFEWETATPESQGMSKERLDALLHDVLIKRNTEIFLVIRNDKIVYEWYVEGYGPKAPHGTASLAKALFGGMSLGLAISEGKIALDDPATKYVPAWESDPLKSKITDR